MADGKSGRPLLFKGGLVGQLNLQICQEGYDVTRLSDRALRKLTAEVCALFQKNLPDVKIVELMLACENIIFIVVGDHVNLQNRSRLPGRIAKCVVKYLRNSELHRPSWADRPAKRQVDPPPVRGIVDKTVYDVLRPGVMISSMVLKNAHPVEYSTTSGVFVHNAGGTRLMTAATHGIDDNGQIWQTGNKAKIVGRAVQEIPFTDISLVELEDGVNTSKQTFENDAGVTPNFTRLATMDDIRAFTVCYLNSPYTGNMAGNIVMRSVKLEESNHPAEDRIRYVVYQGLYTNQVEDNESHVQPPDGTCGSVIWDDDGVVLGFYHYYIEEGDFAGYSVTVSASEMVEAGYSLA
ncbi:hypothetical protein PG997_009018 [Apiospora hydei]|uniref:Uncharacterized protein n=1 Tax=Apiospora hydei TaxID=1337664 RepID=A0ABR1WFE6_9PEZI